MDINRLRVFINLVETKNYTRTANNMHISQPMVTHDIKAIENEVGIKLFDRSTRYVRVTSSGEEFYTQIKPLINRYYSAVQDIRQREYSENHALTIGFSLTPYNNTHITRWIIAFQKENPSVKLYVESLNHNKLKQYLETREIDLFLTSEGDASDIPDSQTYQLTSDQFVAIIPKSNPLASKQRLNIEDFDNQRMIFIDNSWTGVEMVRLQDEIIHHNRNIDAVYVNDIAASSILINAQQGISLGLNFIYNYTNSDLAYVPINWNQKINYVAVVNENNKKQTLQNFIHFIQSRTS